MTEVTNRIITTFRANINFVNIIKPDSVIIKPTTWENFLKNARKYKPVWAVFL